MHPRLPLTVIAIVALAAVGCGGTPATQAPSPQAPAGTEQPPAGTEEPAAGGPTVSIVDNEFDPASLSVSAGDAVTWTNNGQNPHTVTFADGNDSGNLTAGMTFEETFDTAGDFTYVCRIHGNMQGTITVE